MSTGIILPALRQRSRDADAVELRQSEIEKNGVVGLGVAEEPALLAIVRDIDGIPRINERGAQLDRQLGIVFNYQQTHSSAFNAKYLSATGIHPDLEPAPIRRKPKDTVDRLSGHEFVQIGIEHTSSIARRNARQDPR